MLVGPINLRLVATVGVACFLWIGLFLNTRCLDKVVQIEDTKASLSVGVETQASLPLVASEYHVRSLFYPGSVNTSTTRSGGLFDEMTMRKAKNILVNTTNPFYICTAPKTGCTAWKTFFLYINTGILIPPKTLKINPGAVHGNQNASVYRTDSMLLDLLQTTFPVHDRFVVARNPYVRFISSYQDWLYRVGKKSEQVPFPQFVNMVQQRDFSGFLASPINHIDPVSHFCNLESVPYTSVLRVEEQPLWFDAFLKSYKLEDSMERYTAAGNVVFRHDLHGGASVMDYIASIVGKEPWPGKALNSSHHRNSVNMLTDFYTSPGLVDNVTNLIMEDLRRFQYPLWDGDPSSFRFV